MPRTLLLLRHGKKAWVNGKKPAGVEGYPFDPPLSATALWEDTTLSSLERLKDYIPTAIYCSPLLRTRETACYFVEQLSYQEPIQITPLLAEYLGNHRNKEITFCPETEQYFPSKESIQALTTESIRDVKRRMDYFLSTLPKDGVFFIITHGVVIQSVAGTRPPEGGLCIIEQP